MTEEQLWEQLAASEQQLRDSVIRSVSRDEAEDEQPEDPRWAGHECDIQGDMDGSDMCVAPGHPCENGFSTGPREDPYGVQCDLLDDAHKQEGRWVHRGVNPLPGPGPEPQYIEWEGGGMCAGDPLPIRNVRYLANDGSLME